MVHLDYRDARPIYTQIIDGIREQILTGILQTEDRLPSVRELATQLTINPNTIQRAYRELEVQGWIVSVPGKGCFVTGIPESTPKQELLQEFDRITAQLLKTGVARAALVERIFEGGEKNV